LAAFWSQVTGFAEDPDNGNAPDDPEALLLAPDGSMALLFITVPEPKHGKNRLHLDLVPLESRRDQEVNRLLAIGATLVDDQRRSDGTGGLCWPTRKATSSASNAATSNAATRNGPPDAAAAAHADSCSAPPAPNGRSDSSGRGAEGPAQADELRRRKRS